MRYLATLILIALLSACAPSVIERGAARFDAALEADSFIADDGTALRFHTWLPAGKPRAILIAVHGMNEYANAFKWPAEIWCRQGIGVYALDQRGFGASPERGIWPGAENLAADLAAFTRLVKRRHEDLPLFLLGESMGGAVVILAATRGKRLPVDGVILVAPAVAPYEELPIYWRGPLWLLAHTVPWYPLTGRGLRLQPTDNIDVWREMSRDELVIRRTRVDALYGLAQLMDKAASAVPDLHYPTLLLYGDHDDFVREWMVAWVVENAGERRIDVNTYDGGYHWLLRDLGAQEVLDDIVAWMARRAPAS